MSTPQPIADDVRCADAQVISGGASASELTDLVGPDETVRCRMSGICEGPQACPPQLPGQLPGYSLS